MYTVSVPLDRIMVSCFGALVRSYLLGVSFQGWELREYFCIGQHKVLQWEKCAKFMSARISIARYIFV